MRLESAGGGLVLVLAAISALASVPYEDSADWSPEAWAERTATSTPPRPQYHECGNAPFTRHTEHPPIRISGDANFTAANGVTRGTGTDSDPYVIEGWLIFPSGTAGIVVEDTTAHFVIFDDVVCYGRSGTAGFDGIHLDRVTHAGVESTGLRCNLVGLVVTESQDVRVSDVYIPGQEYPCGAPLGADAVERGIIVRDSSEVVIEGVTFGTGTSRLGLELDRVTDVRLSHLDFYSALEAVKGTSVVNLTVVDIEIGGGVGFSLWGSSDIVFERNVVTWTAFGIRLGNSDNATIRGNRYANHGGGGVFLEFSQDIVVDGNLFEGPYGTGLYALSSRRGLVVNNTFKDRIWAAVLRNSIDFAIHHNLFLGNEVPADDDRGSENRWDDGYPSGGNYWSDYAGIDLYSGPNQDEPGSDGIGDAPRAIDGDSRDRYPIYYSPYARHSAAPPVRRWSEPPPIPASVAGPEVLVIAPADKGLKQTLS